MKEAPWDPFARLTAAQGARLAAFRKHLLHFNQRLNLVSRETEADFDERHLLHALALTYRAFPAGSTVVDWGTGGGLPAIPLAIAFPEAAVHAVDAVGKKIQAVRAMARRLDLANLHAWHGRAEDWPGRAAYSVSRATVPLRDLWRWHLRVRLATPPETSPAAWRPGLICLKGGDLRAEIDALRQAHAEAQVRTTPLQPLLRRAYFADKVIVEVFEG